MSPDEQAVRDIVRRGDAPRAPAGHRRGARIWRGGGGDLAGRRGCWWRLSTSRGDGGTPCSRPSWRRSSCAIPSCETSSSRGTSSNGTLDGKAIRACSRHDEDRGARQADRSRARLSGDARGAGARGCGRGVGDCRRKRLAPVVDIAWRRRPHRSQALPPSALRLTATIQPPAYTNLAVKTMTDPPRIEGPQGSTLMLAIESAATAVAVEHDGAIERARARSRGTFHRQPDVDENRLCGGDRRRQKPDDPGRRVAGRAAGRAHHRAGTRSRVRAAGTRASRSTRARPTIIGLRSLALHYTKVSGSGEQFEFQEGEIPLNVARGTTARVDRRGGALARRARSERRRHARVSRGRRRRAARRRQRQLRRLLHRESRSSASRRAMRSRCPKRKPATRSASRC